MSMNTIGYRVESALLLAASVIWNLRNPDVSLYPKEAGIQIQSIFSIRYAMRIVCISFLIIAFLGNLYAQTFRTTEQAYTVDTLRILPAVGYITFQYKMKIYKSDTLNTAFLQMLERAIPDSAKFTLNYSGNGSVLDNPDKQYLMEALPRLQRLNETTFSTVEIGDDFERILANQQGRYFGFIYYEGFDQELPNGWGAGIEIGTSLAALSFTGELVDTFLKSGGPYLLINFLVVDKATRNFLYFNNHIFYTTPFKEKTIHKYFKRICEEI